MFLVFLLDSDGFSDDEKIFLLVSMAALQEYLNYSLPIVSKFLIKFFLIWDGQEYSQQIHSLIEWLAFDSLEDWGTVASVLRVIFRCCDTEAACLLLSSLKLMLRNMVAANMARSADIPLPICNYQHETILFSQLYSAIGKSISDMLVERVSYASRTDNEQLLVANALYFYQEVCNFWFLFFLHSNLYLSIKAVGMEFEGDLHAFIMVPCTLVYNVLLSSHRANIHHLAKLLLR